MSEIPVTGREDLKRDRKTGAILACDKSKLMEAKRIKRENDKYITLEKRIQHLEKLVQTLLESNNQ